METAVDQETKMIDEKEKDVDLSVSKEDVKKEEKDVVSFIKQVIELILLIGSISTGALTAIKAHYYSRFYGIPYVELINTKLTYEMIIRIIPVMLITLLGVLMFLYANRHNVFSKNYIWDNIVMCFMLIVLGATTSVSIYLYMNSVRNELSSFKWLYFLVSADRNVYGIVSAVIIFLFIAISCCIKTVEYNPPHTHIRRIRKKDGKEYEIGSFVEKHRELARIIILTIVSFGCVCCVLFPFLFSTLEYCTEPRSVQNYEIALIDKESRNDNYNYYVTIYSNSSGRLVMKCNAYKYDNNSKWMMIIKKGSYEFIDSKDHQFRYIHMDKVICMYEM